MMNDDVDADAWIATSDDSHVVIHEYFISAMRAIIFSEITYDTRGRFQKIISHLVTCPTYCTYTTRLHVTVLKTRLSFILLLLARVFKSHPRRANRENSRTSFALRL